MFRVCKSSTVPNQKRSAVVHYSLYFVRTIYAQGKINCWLFIFSQKLMSIWTLVFSSFLFIIHYKCFVPLQNTLKSSPPENIVMKKANVMGVLTTTVFYMMCGCFGYAAFGNNAPGNLLTGFGFFEPFWLVDLANMCIVVHLVGAYQVQF